MSDAEFSHRIDAVRRFNRFYTKQIGVLLDRLLQSPYSLTEARVIYELAECQATTATALSADLGLDPGHLSRLLRGLRTAGLLDKRRSASDGRQSLLSLTAAGRQAFAMLDGRSRAEVGAMLAAHPVADQRRMVAAMATIAGVLDAVPNGRPPYMLRPHQPGDMGWVVHRHGVLYSEEYGFDERFEALVATIVAAFIERFEPRRERCWIAEVDGEIVGSVFLVRQSDTDAKLRLLLVDPKARGLGLGARLVAECIRFARQTGYARITLWTNSVLLAARHIYRQAGFEMVDQAPHTSFGQDLVGETWELPLR